MVASVRRGAGAKGGAGRPNGTRRVTPKLAGTGSRRGCQDKNPVSSEAPRSARSLSHGQVVRTYSLYTIRSTTLTRETVTATPFLLRLGGISQRSENYF